MDTDEMWDDEPPGPSVYVDGAWGRTANPNTADGELQNIAAFGSGLARLTGPRRHAARIIVWLLLLPFIIGAIYGVVGMVHFFAG